MGYYRIAVVTGGNKGIGLEICRQLALKEVTVILTARDERRGLEAVEGLKASGLADILFHKLDVVQQSSATSLAAFIEQRFGRLDILIKVKPELMGQKVKQTYETVEQCLWTNYYGNKQVTQALLPLLQQSNSARIVNISSSYGQLKHISNEKALQKLGNVDGLTEDKVDEVVKEFREDAKEGQIENKGWPKHTFHYRVSKAAVNTYTRILANKYPNISINAVHPGKVSTDINFHTGILTVEEGARGVNRAGLRAYSGRARCLISATIFFVEPALVPFVILVEGSSGGWKPVEAQAVDVTVVAAPMDASRMGTPAPEAPMGPLGALPLSISEVPSACSGASTPKLRPRSASSSRIPLSIAS
ncbi:hypothetical protein Nepgr_004463 [Nepenthes gracilis]|uniref:Uncharacterized protein n=1 Tax=Nepenthes gracilis TaxID=150966 RepID=A0AAD3XF59_NEPGR|nr:hypothetical protein Nepgr_004463 [Nepenthes gracilis]